MSFYSSIAKHYDQIFPHRQQRLDFVLSFLEPGEKRIVDLGCATGALALALASEGHEVIALDLNEEMVHSGERECEEHGLSVSFLVKDMCQVEELCSPASVDCALCFGNTLVHLPNEQAVVDFISSVRCVLGENGFFLGQIVNYDRILSLKPRGLPTIDNEFIRFERIYHYQHYTNKIIFEAKLLVKDSQDEKCEKNRTACVDEIAVERSL